jgi:hypothetical protein
MLIIILQNLKMGSVLALKMEQRESVYWNVKWTVIVQGLLSAALMDVVMSANNQSNQVKWCLNV